MKREIRYFEDYQPGESGVTTSGFGTRTLTQTDFTNFACLTADYHRNHLDRHYMAESIYGVNVAHGMLGASLILGMLALNCPHTVGRDVPGAYLYSFDINYRDGIKAGETLSVKWQIKEKMEQTEFPAFGLIKTAYQLVNQDGNPLYDGIATVLVPKENFKNATLEIKGKVPQEVERYVPDPDRDHYAEDYPIGKGGITSGRTITEADVITFCGMVGDYNPLYVDKEYAAGNQFGERIAHPMMIFTYAFGLWARERNNYREPKINVAGHLNDNGRFLYPVRIGDTIRVVYWTESCRISRSRPLAAITVTRLQVLNQKDEVVQDGSVVLMLPSREGLKNTKHA